MGASSIVSQLLPTSTLGFVAAVPVLITLYFISLFLYNIFLHPLRKFPGPIANAISPIPYIIESLKGNGPYYVISLHEKYGEVVRLSPNELSFSGAGAYKDVYGHKKAGLPTLEKDPMFYKSPFGEVDIVNADYHDHARMRRIFSHAFSDRALKMQEPLFNTYVDKLVEKLSEGIAADPRKVFNMIRMYNFTTFDIMGDLTFGEPLNMLSNDDYVPWVAAMFAGFKYGCYLHAVRYLPGVEQFLFKHCLPASMKSQMELNKQLSHQRVDRRLEKENARPDIWGLVLGKEDGKGLNKEEMYSNSNLFMIAGTETTATLLSGLTFYLLTNPSKYTKLVNELRTTFPSSSSITIEKLQALKYLNACIEEGLRMYPPVSPGLPRLTPPGPATSIDGHEVPAGTRVLVTNLAANRNAENWRNPYDFVPERWMCDTPEGALYVNDKRFGFQPFSAGPRACLGKNMAYHEMRLILTKVLYHFDMELCEDSKEWNKQDIFIMWEKNDLNVRLTPVKR